MNIIAQIPEFVNTPDREKFTKWTEKKLKNVKVSDMMIDAGFKKRGYLMRECGTFLQYKICPDCGKSFISSANLCRDRLCPTCAWRLSLKRFSEMCQVMTIIPEYDFSLAGFLTLTVKNCKPENLRFTIQKMNEDWNRMLAGRKMKKTLAGWAKSLEITYNPSTNTFHPHFHIITLFDDFPGEGEANIFFRKAWERASRLNYEPITDFRLIRSKEDPLSLDGDKVYNAILETFKYAVKSDDLEKMPLPVFREFVLAVQGLRFVSFGGVVKDARKKLGIKDTETDDSNEIEINRDNCTCGAELVKIICEWSFTDKQYKLLDL